VLEMGLDQRDLLLIRGIFHGHGLSPAVIEPLKDVDRLVEVEWHHLRATRRNLGLAGTAGQSPEANSDH